MVLGLLDFRDLQGDPSFLALPLTQNCLYFPEGQVYQGDLPVQGGLDLLLFPQVQGVLADQELLVALVCPKMRIHVVASFLLYIIVMTIYWRGKKFKQWYSNFFETQQKQIFAAQAMGLKSKG